MASVGLDAASNILLDGSITIFEIIIFPLDGLKVVVQI
jgi:hypothetical protein